MKRITIALAMALLMISCADQSKRQQYLQKVYPHCKVEPATGLFQQGGYEFIIIDSTNQIIAVEFYPLSETKIHSLRNVR
jgi:hypothetical protein